MSIPIVTLVSFFCYACFFFFFFNETATTEIYTLSLHDALPISGPGHGRWRLPESWARCISVRGSRSEEHTSELQSRRELVCRLLLEKKKTNSYTRQDVLEMHGHGANVDMRMLL